MVLTAMPTILADESLAGSRLLGDAGEEAVNETGTLGRLAIAGQPPVGKGYPLMENSAGLWIGKPFPLIERSNE